MSFTLSFFFIYLILFYFLDIHMSKFFFIGFFIYDLFILDSSSFAQH